MSNLPVLIGGTVIVSAELTDDAACARAARGIRVSLAPERYLIELGPAFLREPLYLHVHEVDGDDRADGGFDWHPDKTRALRFASRHDAEVFGHRHLDSDFFASAHPAADLVGAADHVSEDEVYDLASC